MKLAAAYLMFSSFNIRYSLFNILDKLKQSCYRNLVFYTAWNNPKVTELLLSKGAKR